MLPHDAMPAESEREKEIENDEKITECECEIEREKEISLKRDSRDEEGGRPSWPEDRSSLEEDLPLILRLGPSGNYNYTLA